MLQNIVRVMSAMAFRQVSENLSTVRNRMREVAGSQVPLPRLVCVSKTKAAEIVAEAYDCGERHFGENYANEFEEKSNSLLLACPDIKWHFIGHLQTNKVPKVLGAPNLYMVETVTSDKLATKMNSYWSTNHPDDGPLCIMVQVNTSGEEQKGGVEPANCTSLVNHILTKCPHLKFVGLMTIGRFDHDYSTGPNPDFLCLVESRKDVAEQLKMDISSIELSMGMSADFVEAIKEGSTNIRVGSTIFGARDYSGKKQHVASG